MFLLYIKTEIEQIAKNRNFHHALIADTHNAMGGEISQEDSQDLLTAAKNVLDILITKNESSTTIWLCKLTVNEYSN